MACIKNLANAITYDCTGGSVGIAELYLINRTSVTALTISAENTVTAVTLATGAKTVPVDCIKSGVKVIEALKGSDVANGVDQSLNITLYSKKSDAKAITDAIMNGRFYAAVKYKDLNAIPVMLGVVCGLEVSAMDTDSSANGGFTAITLKTPEDARGERRVGIDSGAWNTIVNAKLT